MPKGYWMAHVTAKVPERYKEYQALNAVAFAKYGARFLVRGGKAEIGHGSLGARHVVIEFDSFEQARACYFSPEYQAAKKVLVEIADVDVAIVEGV